jgi:hypothetical protein
MWGTWRPDPAFATSSSLGHAHDNESRSPAQPILPILIQDAGLHMCLRAPGIKLDHDNHKAFVFIKT